MMRVLMLFYISDLYLLSGVIDIHRLCRSVFFGIVMLCPSIGINYYQLHMHACV